MSRDAQSFKGFHGDFTPATCPTCGFPGHPCLVLFQPLLEYLQCPQVSTSQGNHFASRQWVPLSYPLPSPITSCSISEVLIHPWPCPPPPPPIFNSSFILQPLSTVEDCSPAPSSPLQDQHCLLSQLFLTWQVCIPSLFWCGRGPPEPCLLPCHTTYSIHEHISVNW